MATKIRLFSDIHNEFIRDVTKGSNYCIPELETDCETILVLAGDIDHRGHTVKRLIEYSERFEHVICVYGNHDFWRSKSLFDAIPSANKKLKALGITNVHILDRKSIQIEDVLFVGATLWTDYNDYNPSVMFRCQTVMNDHKYIKLNTQKSRKVSPTVLAYEHKCDVSFIQQQLELSTARKNVVVTHHAPCYLSISEYHRNNPTLEDYAYYTELGNWIVRSKADYWLHGHVHDSKVYNIGDCEVHINAKGYPGEQGTGFNSTKIITI